MSRSTVYSTNGMAASSQPLASQIAINLLNTGCNAVEAAIGCSAALAVLEPSMTSLGDAFIMHFDAQKQEISGLNGSGKSSNNISLKLAKEIVGHEAQMLPSGSALSVTVPGQCALWFDALERYGTNQKTMLDLLQPAINLARNGFPVSKVSSAIWQSCEGKLKSTSLLVDGKRAPREGELFYNLELANLLEKIAWEGRNGFYMGETASKIVSAVKKNGGVLDKDDLKSHETLVVKPIGVQVLNTEYTLWELPPNNHGVVALLTLNLMKAALEINNISLKTLKPNSVVYLHLLIECLKLSFQLADEVVGDPQLKLPGKILTLEFALKHAVNINLKEASNSEINTSFHSDTSYYTVVDKRGNACSMISSLYHNFGCGIVPEGCGFALHNRGCNFSLEKNHVNSLKPGTRPYHTIIPAMILKNGKFDTSFGVMGGFMQPQGHVQVCLNMILFKMSPQQALDVPRVCLTPINTKREIPKSNVMVNLELGFDDDIRKQLESMNHKVRISSKVETSLFGRGQVIRTNNGVLSGGSDWRGDGCAMPQV